MNSLVCLWNVFTKKMVTFTTRECVVKSLLSYNRFDDVRVTWITCNTEDDALCLKNYFKDLEVDSYISKNDVCVENYEIKEVVYDY